MDMPSDPQTIRLLWLLLTGVAVITGFFIKVWISGLKKDREEIRDDLEALKDEVIKKLDNERCLERHSRIKESIDRLFRHKHPLYKDENGKLKDRTGEVIIPYD